MTASKPSEPPASPLSKFNPGWVGAVVLGVSGVVALSGGWLAIERHGSDIKELQIWKASKDVSDTQLRVDVQYIKESQQRTEAAITRLSSPQPQIVYLPMPQGQQVQPPQRAGMGGQ